MNRTELRTCRTLLAAIASLVLLLQGHDAAGATEQLRLRSNITVSDEIVRVGDLFENAGSAADIPIFRAPTPGHTGFLTATRIAYAIRGHGLAWDNPFRISEIAVYRDGRQIPLSEIEDAIKHRIEQLDTNKLAGDLELTFDETPAPMVVPSDAADTVSVLHADYEPRSGRFVAIVSTAVEAGSERRKYSGRAVDVVSAPVLSHRISRGSQITASDVAVSRLPRSAVPTNALFEIADVVGMVATRTLAPGAIMRARDVERPKIVRRSELVTVIYAAPGLQLTTRAQAMESGSMGDVVSIMNPRSKRVIEAVVTGPGTVSAALAAPTRLAASQ